MGKNTARQIGARMALDFSAAKAILARDILGFCQTHLKPGSIKGDWWVCSVPWRVDRNPSFIVNLKTGWWRDCANEGDRGSVIDLHCRVLNKSAIDVVKEACGG